MSAAVESRRARVQASVALAAALALGACGAAVETRGYLPDNHTIEKLEPGRHSRDDVAQMLGTPSSITPFADDTWLYISRKTSQFAFLNPRVLEQNVLVVTFNGAGTVADVKRYTLEDGKVFDPVSRATPAQGRELGLVEQLIGNLGRFNNAGSTK